jgi:hypothetical protein
MVVVAQAAKHGGTDAWIAPAGTLSKIEDRLFTQP